VLGTRGRSTGLPWGLRALLGYDRVLAARVASAFAGELDRSLKKRAKAARLLFHALGTPTRAEVADVARRTAPDPA
jgi:hypothetical protein